MLKTFCKVNNNQIILSWPLIEKKKELKEKFLKQKTIIFVFIKSLLLFLKSFGNGLVTPEFNWQCTLWISNK